MATSIPIADLRAATEDDVAQALDGAACQPQCSPAELLELFNRMLDVLVGEPDEECTHILAPALLSVRTSLRAAPLTAVDHA